MNQQLQRFQHEEFGNLEILIIGGKPYFPATACAKILGYTDPYDAIKRHTKGSVKHRVLTSGGEQEMNCIPEGDLYRLIIRSRLPAAIRFEEWVFDEVLPTIRETGGYTMETHPFNTPAGITSLCRHYLILDAENKKLAARVEELAPKARYYDLILQSKNAVQVSVIAKDYGISAVAFNALLHDLGIQYKMGNTWLLYQKYASEGYAKSRTFWVNENKSVTHTYWRQKGRLFLYETLKEHGIVPCMEHADAAEFSGERGRGTPCRLEAVTI